TTRTSRSCSAGSWPRRTGTRGERVPPPPRREFAHGRERGPRHAGAIALPTLAGDLSAPRGQRLAHRPHVPGPDLSPQAVLGTLLPGHADLSAQLLRPVPPALAGDPD